MAILNLLARCLQIAPSEQRLGQGTIHICPVEGVGSSRWRCCLASSCWRGLICSWSCLVVVGISLLERFHFLWLNQLIFTLPCRLGRRSLVAVSEVPPSSLTTEVLAVKTKWIWDYYHITSHHQVLKKPDPGTQVSFLRHPKSLFQRPPAKKKTTLHLYMYPVQNSPKCINMLNREIFLKSRQKTVKAPKRVRLCTPGYCILLFQFKP